MMDWGNLFSRAWNIVWSNKFMFVLGFLAALGTGGSSGGNFNYRVSADDLPPGFAFRIESFMEQYWPLLAGLSCLAVFVALVLWVIRLVAQAGMISSAARLDAGEKVSFGEAVSAGAGKLWPVIGINVLMYGWFSLLLLLVLGTGLALFASAVGTAVSGYNESFALIAGSLGIFYACIGLLICIALPVLLVVSVIYPFAQRGAVLQELGVLASISHGWQVVKRNLGAVVILVIFFLALGIGFVILAALITLPMGFLVLLPTMVSVVNTGSLGAANFLILAAGGVCLVLVIAALNAVLVSFRSATITLAYQDFVSKLA